MNADVITIYRNNGEDNYQLVWTRNVLNNVKVVTVGEEGITVLIPCSYTAVDVEPHDPLIRNDDRIGIGMSAVNMGTVSLDEATNMLDLRTVVSVTKIFQRNGETRAWLVKAK